MLNTEFRENRRIVFTNFEDKHTMPNIHRGVEDYIQNNCRSLTPIMGEKINTLKNIKVQIHVKMPKLPKEKREHCLFKPPTFIQPQSFSPKSIARKPSIQYFSPKKTEFKLLINNSPEPKPKTLPNLKHRQSSTGNHNKPNIYSKLLSFLIKVQVDFIPIYLTIDIHRKGWIELNDFQAFFFKCYPNLDPDVWFQRLLDLNSVFVKDSLVLKRNFLALCTGLQYKKQPGKDFRAIFMVQPQEVLKDTLQEYVKSFAEFTDKRIIDMRKLVVLKSFKDDKAQRSLQTVFSEPVDLQRFIHCYPFFKWLKSHT